ncbi:Carboxylesterase type B [Pseudopedobacter saltans DSM 12145]|uniref:Carboxylesterase type B n=2 Tax=Pseudopedobacter saltans TaxID=151895 RepID=F0S8N3_PSESL|nr:Carboxylesterase type B [Pseudopedobacter saltans DSM 12145]
MYAYMLLLLFIVKIGYAQQVNPENQAVKISKDIRYAEKTDSSQNDISSDRLLDLYLPTKISKSEKLPVYMFIHGGGFSGGDKEQTAVFCNKLASNGMAVVSINYLLYLKLNKIKGASCSANMSKGLPTSGKFQDGLHHAIYVASADASLALKWIKENANKYNFNLKKVAISGGSAGAMTALYTALCKQPQSQQISAIVNLWGGLENNNQIVNTNIPVLTFHGDKDALISVDYAYSLHEFLEKKGNKSSKLVIMEGIGHAAYTYITNNKVEEILSFLNEAYK